jgi:gamma-glutamyl-gamma-aminobutyrate hydrolase PuuD
MFSGSPLHIYDRTLEVTRQIDFARAAFTAGLPAWGSCWGLQLATVALGGTVRRMINNINKLYPGVPIIPYIRPNTTKKARPKPGS